MWMSARRARTRLRAIWHAAALLGRQPLGRKRYSGRSQLWLIQKSKDLANVTNVYKRIRRRENIGERCTKRGTLHRTLHANGGAVEITLNAGTPLRLTLRPSSRRPSAHRQSSVSPISSVIISRTSASRVIRSRARGLRPAASRNIHRRARQLPHDVALTPAAPRISPPSLLPSRLPALITSTSLAILAPLSRCPAMPHASTR